MLFPMSRQVVAIQLVCSAVLLLFGVYYAVNDDGWWAFVCGVGLGIGAASIAIDREWKRRIK